MTFCLGIKLKTGLIAIADTRITSGTETTMAKKVYIYIRETSIPFLL